MKCNVACSRRRLGASTSWSVIVAFGLCFTFVAEPPSYAQPSAGTISAINGNATLTRGGRIIPATYGAPIDVGDQITTTANGRLTVTFGDGSQLELTESGTLLVSQNLQNPSGTRARTIVTLLGGLVRSLVRVTAGTPPNYEVHTPNAVAAARGTTYDTYFTNNTSRPAYKSCKEFTDVAVYDGIVDVSSLTNPSSPTVEVHSGQKTTVPCGLAVLPATALAATAGGLGAGTITGLTVGTLGAIAGGVVGGIAATGGFGGGASPSRRPISPK
jgi:FecR protein